MTYRPYTWTCVDCGTEVRKDERHDCPIRVRRAVAPYSYYPLTWRWCSTVKTSGAYL